MREPAWAHMPIGIVTSHTKFGEVWSSHLAAVSEGVGQIHRLNT